jgi:uncharacterized phage protein gp47/JayE
MAYTAPTITGSGLSIPTYNDILEELVNEARIIYGQDIYLGTDSQDYQFLSIFASKAFDIMQLLQLVYNNRSPGTAVGLALDSIVKMNGISRKAKSYSTCPVILSGTALTLVNNGVVQDITGYKWNLPSTVTIGSEGTVTVTATCQVAGPISASVGDISLIVTPTYGWTSVTNSVSASLGSNTETDAELRARQSISVSLTGLTVLDSIRGAIAELPSVIRYKIYENDTNTIDANGLVAHSIAAVADGGTDSDIANAIFKKKAPGVYTQGTTSVSVIDNYGQANTIRFYRPIVIDIDIVVNVKKLAGYTDQATIDIKSKLTGYLNSLTIGNGITISSLWGAALSAMTSLSNPTFSITSLTAAIHGDAQGTTDIPIDFNEAIHGTTAYITVNATT